MPPANLLRIMSRRACGSGVALVDRPSLSDPLAGALWDARASATPLALEDWPEVPPERGEAVAGELYGALRAQGAALLGAKMGATDEQMQRALGTDRPLIAPIHDSMALADGATISLAELIAPRLEPE